MSLTSSCRASSSGAADASAASSRSFLPVSSQCSRHQHFSPGASTPLTDGLKQPNTVVFERESYTWGSLDKSAKQSQVLSLHTNDQMLPGDVF